MVRIVIILALTFIGLTILPAAAQRTASYNKLPLSFEPDGGQFLARGEGYLLRLTPTRETLRLNETSSVTLTLVGANPSAQAETLDPLPGKTNYLVGNDPAKWRTNVANFARVRYRDIYPGVDIVYYGNRQQLEYDLVVNPGADPHPIQLAFDGIQSMRIAPDGDLLLAVPGGDIRQHKPVIYQESDGVRLPVEGRYVRRGNRIGFELAKYDARRRLIIDPRLTYSTFLGSISRSHKDQANALAVDSAGNAYVTGWTMSPDFPLKGAIQTVYRAPFRTAFVTKLNASGTALVYSTYLGGTGVNGDEGRGIAVDSSGHAYVAGTTVSPDFPITPNAFQTVFHGGSAFVSKLNAAGDGLLYSTYLGLSNLDGAQAIAVDASENAYVTGFTQSSNFPVTPGAYQTTPSGVWVSKLNTTASGPASLVYSTYIGKGLAMSRGIAVDSSGNAYITGITDTAGFSTPGAFQTSYHAGSGNDGFVTKLNAAGSALVYSTYLGGTNDDAAYGIAVDPLGNALVAGSTISTDFPVTPGAFQTTFQAGRSHCFVTKVNPGGDGLIYSTFLAGTGDVTEQCNAIATDFAGNAYVAGSTTSITFPVTSDGFRNSTPSSVKGFASKLSAAGDRLIFSTYLTGDNQDIAYGIAVDPVANAYVTGYSTSTGFPVTPGAFQTLSTPCCTGKAFVTAIAADIGVRLAQSGLTFQAVQGGGVPSPKSFRFFNATSVPMNYSVAASTLSGGSWLTASPNSGTLNPDQPANISVSVNPAGLAPGDYYGQVRIDGTAAPNAPQFLTIVLNVSTSTTNPGPVVEPAGLAFIGLVGATTPLAQSVHMTNLTNRNSSFTAAGTSTSATNWFTISPASGTPAPNQPLDIKVQPNAGLPAGVYRGSLVIQFPQDATNRTVDLLMVVGPSATTTCTPTKLLPVLTSPGPNFNAPVAWPEPIEVMVLNDCGSAILNGSIVASFSNGDPSLTLRSQLDGHWSATWDPRNPRASTTVTVTAQQPEINVQGTVQVSGSVPDNPGIPALNVGPMVSSASYLGRPSPGELVAVFGINLSDGLAVSPVLPLQTQLQGSLLIFAGRPMPLLYTSPLQVNAMVPYQIAPGITYQLIAQHGTRLSVPQEVTVASVQPAVFTTDSSVNGQGHIYINVNATQVRADSSMPAKAGDVLTIYCEGLGAVVPSIDAGAAVDRLIKTVNPVGVTIGGVPATVLFAGLTPGFTGLYQVNVIVPAGVAPGSSVPVVVSEASISSPPVTITVQ